MNLNEAIFEKIITQRSIKTDFQPIYSLNTNQIIGIEALSRGYVDNEIISPFFLFKYAKENDKSLILDKVCREKAMEAFTKQTLAPTLFLNFEASVLNDFVPSEQEIMSFLTENNINPKNVVIEINEALVKDSFQLLMFVDMCRSLGFIIALDNVGTGESTQNRIMLVNPDIIKIDRAIVMSIESNTYNREVFRSIVAIAKKIGALTVAEGVETIDEVITCILLGVDYFQGYFFSKPEQIESLYSNDVRIKLDELAKSLNLTSKNNSTVTSVKIETYKRIIDKLIEKLKNIPENEYQSAILEHISNHREIECAFLINERGFQITDTILAPDITIIDGFTPALIGDNHDIKNYFYAIREQIEDPFISGWYVSAATGQKCKTLSSHFRNEKGEMIIVCIDLKSK